LAEEGKIVEKVWGEEHYITNRSEYCSKWLYVNPFSVCSEHMHPIKVETFHVVIGRGVISVGDELKVVLGGDTVHIPAGTYHLFATSTGMTLLEVSTQHSDEDVVRRTESHRLSTVNDVAICKALNKW
jgi:mannose-6-phosphate isomerase-like protein (cupin superfamily)